MSKFKFKIGDKVRVVGSVPEQFVYKCGKVLEESNSPFVSFDEYLEGTYEHDGCSYVYAFHQNDLELIEAKEQPEESKDEFVEDNEQPEDNEQSKENAPDSITHTITIEKQTIKLSHAGLRKLKNMLTGVEL